MEGLTPDGSFSVDALMRDERIAVEADGIYHQLANCGDATGETLARRRLLAARGYAVAVVPGFEWPAGPLAAQQAYLQAVSAI